MNGCWVGNSGRRPNRDTLNLALRSVRLRLVRTFYLAARDVNEGNNTDGESKKLGTKPDGASCKYDDATVVMKN